MIGLVLVSHSAALAAGVRELAEGMARVPIALAAGIDDPDHPIGTDALKVLAAIESVYSPDGVVVLMDLGSALLSAETALELLDDDKRPHVFLSDASFVEGAIAAAVQAGIGSPVERVLAEARGALAAKQSSDQSRLPVLPAEPSRSALSIRLIVPNRLGLHARPSARLVSVVGQFKAAVTLRMGERSADARSINSVALLGARQGDELEILAAGDDAQAALDAIRRLADDNFGDRDDAEPLPQSASPAHPDGVLVGIGASKGLAVGQVYLLTETRPELPAGVAGNVDAELARLESALTAADADLEALMRSVGVGEAAIFGAHRLMLRDDGLLNDARERIRHSRAETGWWGAVEAMAARYRQAENEVVRARAADVVDIGRRVLRHLAPGTRPGAIIPEGRILAAPDISPSEAAQLDPRKVLGIVTAQGGATSHAAIIARGLGIPAVVGVGVALADLRDGQTILLDGENGWLYPHPTEAQIAVFRQAIRDQRAEQGRVYSAARLPAVTTDGRRVEVAANIGAPTDGLPELGAEGVGLFRTELLFMPRTSAPTEDEQFQTYMAAAEKLDGHPLTIRTLDAGGDKPIPYLGIGREDNPFLGYRGIRFWLDQPDLALTQLRAACRASARHPIRLMFPMVSTLDELDRARGLLRRAHEQLAAEAIPFNPDMPVGIMIEVPSAVLLAAQFAEQVDFFSIGTNDLTQYLMASDRGNARVSPLATGYQPALLGALRQVIDAARARGKPVGVCGEMAGDPRFTRLLLGLGVDELSMNAPAIPEIKAIIRAASYTQAQADAAHALTLATAAQVEAFVSGTLRT